MNFVVVIPARGGSKSIPLKNIQLLGGRPLISYTIEYAKQSKKVSHVVVSTDNEEIAQISKKYGAEVPFLRPDEISGDAVQDYPVIKHALEVLEGIYQEKIDAIVWLRPTSPLRPVSLIEKAYSLLEEHPNCTSIRSVVKSTEHPYRQWKINGVFMEGVSSNIFESYNMPRQKLPDVYFQSGDIEVVRRETILNNTISGDRVIPLIIQQKDMLDIDHFNDLKKAEHKLNQKQV